MDRRHDRPWPERMEPLRPDDVARRRLRSGILREALPLLEVRQGDAWWGLAAWASRLVPVAAAAAVFFAWLASHAVPQRAIELDRTAAVDDTRELIVGQSGGAPPAVLTDEAAPSSDAVLTAAVYESP